MTPLITHHTADSRDWTQGYQVCIHQQVWLQLWI